MSEHPDTDDVEQLRTQVQRLKAENERLRASNRRWMRIAGTDELTGLPNRVFFSTALLPQQIARSDSEGTPFACVILAPDQLGEINQAHGRSGGDAIVKAVAEFVKQNLDDKQRLIHFDGANFVALMPGSDLADAKKLAYALRARMVTRTFRCGDAGVSLTLSMGSIARTAPPDGQSADVKDVIDQVIRKLTAALDQAKKGGRDRLHEDTDTVF